MVFGLIPEPLNIQLMIFFRIQIFFFLAKYMKFYDVFFIQSYSVIHILVLGLWGKKTVAVSLNFLQSTSVNRVYCFC